MIGRRSRWRPRLLIVNADDYGLTRGVSRAILQAHQDGIVTSTSVLALARAFTPTVGSLRDTAGIGVGAHLAAVGEDPPLLTALEIPTLVDGQGRLSTSWRRFLLRTAARQIDPEDVRLEFAAQIERIKGEGLAITHLDTHQHLHLWPGVAAIVVDLAVANGIPAVRVARTSSRAPVGLVVRPLGARLARRARKRGLRFTAASCGLDHAGQLDADRMRAAIARLGAGRATTAELSTHPGQRGDGELDRYQWGYRWGDELEALLAPETRAAVYEAGFMLGTYADLPGPGVQLVAAVDLPTGTITGTGAIDLATSGPPDIGASPGNGDTAGADDADGAGDTDAVDVTDSNSPTVAVRGTGHPDAADAMDGTADREPL